MRRKISDEIEQKIIECRLKSYNAAIIESLVKICRTAIQNVLDRNGVYIEYQSKRNLRKDEVQKLKEKGLNNNKDES